MISDVFFPRINGVSTSIATFVKEIKKQGHTVHLIAPAYKSNRVETPVFEGDWIFRIPSNVVLFDPEDRLMSKKKVRALLPSLQTNNYDVLHIHTPFVAHYMGIWIADKLNLPVVETYHTFFEEYFFHYVPFLPKALLKFLARKFSVSQCRQVDHIVVPSSPMMNVLQKYGVTTAHTILPTGVSIKGSLENSGSSFRNQQGISSNQPVLVHIGRVAFEKNIEFLLQVTASLVKLLPELIFIIAGEGPALKQLKSFAQKLGISNNVKFVGYLDRDKELSACYQAGDVFVFSSRTETQGLVLLEAMLLGVPVVSTAVMGTKDILVNGKGALIANEQVDDFADKVLKILHDPELKTILSTQGISYAQSWHPSDMAKRLISLYEELQTQKDCVTKPSHAC